MCKYFPLQSLPTNKGERQEYKNGCKITTFCAHSQIKMHEIALSVHIVPLFVHEKKTKTLPRPPYIKRKVVPLPSEMTSIRRTNILLALVALVLAVLCVLSITS